MKLLEERILKDAKLQGEIIKVDSFLNQKIDTSLIRELGAEWYSRFKDDGVTKILTIESAGIGLACVTAEYFGVDVVFARKTSGSYADGDVYSSKVVSFTHGGRYNVTVPRAYIERGDRVLIIDDILANGSALRALIDVCTEAGATVVGAGIAIEKTYLGGSERIREAGLRIESLTKIASLEGGVISFC